ncbi:MAG: ATP-binding protein [bacterium]
MVENVSEQQTDSSEHSLESTTNDASISYSDELEQFIYLASHDLQEPIRKIVGYAELLENDLANDDRERVEEDLHYIVNSAERLQSMIQSLLELSRVDRGDPELVRVNTNESVGNTLENLEFFLNDHQAEVDHGDLPPVMAEPEKLTQVYQNLIENGIKYNESSPPKIWLTGDRDGDHVILGVKDNGIGISEEYVDKIFKPLKRLQSRRDYQGSGLGLTICEKIMKRFRGEIWVESWEQGSHFKFRLRGVNEDA